MKFALAKLRHGRLGQSSERSAVLEQLELSRSRLKVRETLLDDHRKLIDAARADPVTQMVFANRPGSPRLPLGMHFFHVGKP